MTHLEALSQLAERQPVVFLCEWIEAGPHMYVDEAAMAPQCRSNVLRSVNLNVDVETVPRINPLSLFKHSSHLQTMCPAKLNIYELKIF